MLHDLTLPTDTAGAQPSKPLPTPLSLFAETAFHGGVWRCAFKMDSLGPIAAVCFYLSAYGRRAGAAGLILTSLALAAHRLGLTRFLP